MLLDQEGRRHEDRDLLAILDGLECGPHCNFRLSIPDITTDESIHRREALHIDFDLINTSQLVRCLDIGERIFELSLPGSVRCEGVPGAGLAGRIQAHQFTGDFSDRLSRPALRFRPITPPEAVHAGRFTPHVPGDHVELVHRKEQSIRRLTALTGCVLDDQVLPFGSLHRSSHHFDVSTDTVMLVHDEIPGCQGQWIDGLATTTRETLPIGGARSLPEQISLGDQRESRQDETLATVAANQVHDPIRRTRHLVFDSGRDVAVGHLLTEPLEGAFPSSRHDDVASFREPPADVGEGFFGVAPILPGSAGAEVHIRVYRGQGVEGPPSTSTCPGVVVHLVQGPVGGGFDVDRHIRANGCAVPSRFKELLSGPHHVRRPGRDALRLADDYLCSAGKKINEGHHGHIEKCGQRLHSFDRDSCGDLLTHLRYPGSTDGQFAGLCPHAVGEQ